MLELYAGIYRDWNVKHFHEQLVKRHGYKLGYTVTKVHLQRAVSMARGISSLLAKQNSSVWRVLRSTVKVIGITNFGRPPAAFRGWWDG